MRLLEVRQAPETLAELAHELAVLAGHIDALTRGIATLAKEDRPAALFDRMEQAGLDGACTAFHGVLYAWIVAKMPHLESVASIEAQGYREEIVLRSGGHKVSLRVDRCFAHINDEWQARP